MNAKFEIINGFWAWNCTVMFSRIQCLSFLSSLQYLRPKEKGTQVSYVGQCLIVYFDVNDGRVSNMTDSLEHRCNLTCVSLSYRYYNGFSSRQTRELIPMTFIFLSNTRLFWQAHSFLCGLVALFVCATPLLKWL